MGNAAGSIAPTLQELSLLSRLAGSSGGNRSLVVALPVLQPLSQGLNPLTSSAIAHSTGAFKVLEGKARPFQLEVDLPSGQVESWV